VIFINTYPLLISSDIIGGIVKIILGFIVFTHINEFVPTPAEYIIIVMLCVFGILSGVSNLSPYLDEWGNRIVQWAGFKFRGIKK
jgi:hypothetical protein